MASFSEALTGSKPRVARQLRVDLALAEFDSANRDQCLDALKDRKYSDRWIATAMSQHLIELEINETVSAGAVLNWRRANGI